MAKKAKTQPCPLCGGTMKHARRLEVLEYQGAKKSVRTLGWWCAQCGEAILEGDALRERERELVELKATVDNVLGPAEVARIRDRLGLSQRRAGALLGGGPHAFFKYEQGKTAVSVPMSRLLLLLANDPARLNELPPPGGVPGARGSARRASARLGSKATKS